MGVQYKCNYLFGGDTMKYQASVDGAAYADYYILDKALDHARVALEDDRFSSVSLTKVNDDGSAFQANTDAPVVESAKVADVAQAAPTVYDPATGA
jgi:hypothetical protein